MTVYRVTGPDGTRYRVTGPEGATEAEVIAQIQSQIAAGTAAPSRTAGLPKPPPARKSMSLPDRLTSVAGAVADTIIPNGGDEIEGGINWALSGGAPGSFQEGRQNFARRQTEWTQPGNGGRAANFIARGAGFIPAARAAGLKIMSGPTRAAQAANASATGAAAGAIGGGFTGDTAAERTKNAYQGGTFGAVVGGAFPYAAAGAHKVGRWGRDLVSPMIEPARAARRATEAAGRTVQQALADGGQNLAQAASEVGRRVQMGVPAVLADVADSSRQLFGWASRGVGPGQQMVRDMATRRQSAMAERMHGHVEGTLGSTANPLAQSEALKRKAQEAAAPLYAKAYRQPVEMTPALQDFARSPVGPAAIRQGKRDLLMVPGAQRSPGSTEWTEGQDPTLEVWDGAKRYLDDLEFDTNSRFIPNPTGMSSDTRGLDMRRRQLLDELDRQVPAYAEARKAYAGPIQDKAAFEAGMGATPGSGVSTAEEAMGAMRGMTPSQVEQFRLGDRTRLGQSIYGGTNSTPRWADASRQIIGNDGRLDTLATVHGRERVNALRARAEAERDAHLTFREALAGSSTANRQAFDGEAGLEAASQAARGNFVTAAATIAMNAMRGTVGRYGSLVRTEVGKMLTEANPANIRELARMIEERAAKDRKFAELLNRAGREASQVTTVGVLAGNEDRPGD